MQAVEEALFQDFERWKREKASELDETHKEDIDTFMETEYAMKVGKGNIFDTIKALVLPPTSRDSPSSSLALENLATCREDRSLKTNRTKRAPADGNINCSELIFSRWLFSECQSTGENNFGWDFGLVNDKSFILDVYKWEDCAAECSKWRGENKEICEFWEHCAYSACLTGHDNPPSVSFPCLFKAPTDCNSPGKVEINTAITSGTCPSSSGTSSSDCAQGEKGGTVTNRQKYKQCLFLAKVF